MGLSGARWMVGHFLRTTKIAICSSYHAIDFVKYAHRSHVAFQCRVNLSLNMKIILSHLLTALIAAHRRPSDAGGC